ncbi:arfaptin-1-like [Aplochiton taeniatus]
MMKEEEEDQDGGTPPTCVPEDGDRELGQENGLDGQENKPHDPPEVKVQAGEKKPHDLPEVKVQAEQNKSHDLSEVKVQAEEDMSHDLSEVKVQAEENEDPVSPLEPPEGSVVVPGNQRMPASQKLERVRKWSLTAFKCTKQILSERLGRGSRTVDLDLKPQLEILQDDKQRYDQVTSLAQTLSTQLSQLNTTQRILGDAFADLSNKTPSLHVEFGLNADAQRLQSKRGESLVAAINSFTADMDTLINKTIEDTLLNVKQYETARIEYDAYRCDMEEASRNASTQSKLEQAERSFQAQRGKYSKTRDDLAVKLKLLEENKVKVLHNKLLLLHGAMASYNTSCHQHLETSMTQAGQTLAVPSTEAPSWLENS